MLSRDRPCHSAVHTKEFLKKAKQAISSGLELQGFFFIWRDHSPVILHPARHTHEHGRCSWYLTVHAMVHLEHLTFHQISEISLRIELGTFLNSSTSSVAYTIQIAKGEWDLVRSKGNAFEQGDLIFLFLGTLGWVVRP